MTAVTLHLGCLRSGVVLAIIFCFLALRDALFRRHRYVVDDVHPHSMSGGVLLGLPRSLARTWDLNWGPGNVAFMFTLLIVVIVAVGHEQSSRSASAHRLDAEEMYRSHD